MSHNVLITGASKGIGKATALYFASMGYNTIITSSNSQEQLHTLYNSIINMGVRCFEFTGDISDYSKVNELFKCLEAESLLPDIIINNAAISHIGLLQDMSIEEWNRILSVNLTGVFNTCNIAIPHMVNNKNGRIINISSMWGCTGASCEVAYSTTKGGLNTFTKALAKELAPSNISINAIAFGVVDTSMNSFLSEEELTSIKNDIPAGRILTPDEAAEIIYNVSQFNTYVTGQIITADGGYT